jgi:N-acyl-D-aspartate/D-glutamate deacylase
MGRFLTVGRRGFLSLPVVGAVAAKLGVNAQATTATTSSTLDLIIRGGSVIDGTGAPAYPADVGIAGGYIAAVGDLSGATAAREIDATGLVVAPGFIDVHSHGELSVLPVAESSLRQGVTTEILHPDGGGIIRIAERLATEIGGLGINIGVYIGFNAVWSNVVGNEDRRATADEVDRMRRIVVSGLANGGWGVSAGLAYTPAYFAQTDQVIEVTEAARAWRTNFPNHIRNEADDVIEATEETIVISENAGMVPVITHMKVMGPGNWGKSEDTVGLIEEANGRGIYTAADVYPYLRSQTGINATIPAWVRDGGDAAMRERFDDPELRPQIREEIEALMLTRVPGPEGIWVRALGQTVADAAASRWDDSPVTPGEAIIRIRLEEGNTSCIWTFGHEDDFRRILLNPTTAVASDGGASTSATTHPRRYGTFPRVLGHYVREEGLLSLEEAVFKMTYLPATMIGMVDRGLLAPGMAADVTVFDPETVIDNATFEEPRQLADGIEHVLVNGQVALTGGTISGVQAGRSLRRTGSMPTRPVTGPDGGRARVSGRLVPLPEREPDGQTFATDFSDDEVGAAPDGWTRVWRDGNWTVLDGPRRLRMGSTAGRKALTWDAVGDVEGDVELFGVFRGSGHDTLFHLGIQTAGSAGSEDTYFLRARVEGADTSNQLQIGRYLDGGYFTQVSAEMPFPVQQDAWYRVLFAREGEWLRGKMWPDGDDEPVDWSVQVHVYDGDQVGGGRGGVGPSHCCSGAVTEWTFISAGTGGQRAPRPAGDPPPAEDRWTRAQVAFNVAGNGVTAKGTLVLTDQDRGLTFRSTSFGKLQTADGWASVTGRGTVVGESAERAFVLILDERDPLSDQATTVTVEIEGGYRITGVLANGSSSVG